jgi:tetratricopeptide (TPR) repeat protein
MTLYKLARLTGGGRAEPHFREAATLQEKLVNDFPNVWDYRWDLSFTLQDLGLFLSSHNRPDEAQQQFARAAVVYAPTVSHREKLAREIPSEQHDGWLASSYTRLGWFLQMSQQPDEAIRAYRKAIAVRQRMLNDSKQFWRLPGLAANHLACAQCFTMKARPAEAANEYQRAGEFLDKAMAKPSSGLLNECNVNNVAWYLATAPDPQFRDPARAVKLAKTSVEIAPNRGDIWNTLGVARYRTGDWQGAIQALNKSMELRAGGNPADWHFLAMAEWQLGNKDAARVCPG